MLITGGFGALVGAIVGAIGALAFGWADRRFRVSR
jgi:gas vesicle protein